MSDDSRSERDAPATLDDLRSAEDAAVFLVECYHFVRSRFAWPDKRMMEHEYSSPAARAKMANWLHKFSECKADAAAKIERVETEIRNTRDEPFRFDKCSSYGDSTTAHEAAMFLAELIAIHAKVGICRSDWFKREKASLSSDPEKPLGPRLDSLEPELIINGFDGVMEEFSDKHVPWPHARDVEPAIEIETAKAIVTYRGMSHGQQTTPPTVDQPNTTTL